MNIERFAGQQRWVLGLVAATSFIAVIDGMVVTTRIQRNDRVAAQSIGSA